jgi:hypothetical protein
MLKGLLGFAIGLTSSITISGGGGGGGDGGGEESVEFGGSEG